MNELYNEYIAGMQKQLAGEDLSDEEMDRMDWLWWKGMTQEERNATNDWLASRR